MLQPDRRTKIVATIGPASSDEATLATLVDAGMDGVRLNFSHGTHADHERSAQRARESSPFAQRVARRPMSWFEPAQQGHA